MEITRKKITVLKQECIGTDIYDMTVDFPEAAAHAVPGQFIDLYSNQGEKLLPRPISICDYNAQEGTVRMVYRVTGRGTGTEEFSGMAAGDTCYAVGPLGRGYTLQEDRAILIGGGIGIPPMLALAKRLSCEKTVVLGYRDELFLKEAFDQTADIVVATEDGSAGVKGTVLDAIREERVSGRIIYACGPMPMLRAVAEYAKEHNMEAQISLEERMACGIGACLGCITKTKSKGTHTNVYNQRVCKDGPVFDAKEVIFS